MPRRPPLVGGKGTEHALRPGLLARGSSLPHLPSHFRTEAVASRCGKSPLTAAGPRWICTTFPRAGSARSLAARATKRQALHRLGSFAVDASGLRWGGALWYPIGPAARSGGESGSGEASPRRRRAPAIAARPKGSGTVPSRAGSSSEDSSRSASSRAAGASDKGPRRRRGGAARVGQTARVDRSAERPWTRPIRCKLDGRGAARGARGPDSSWSRRWSGRRCSPSRCRGC